MATTHTVQPGENLARIAKQYKIANWRDIYHSPDNAEFRKKRPNPNILMAGDVLTIPEQQQKTVYVRTGARHRFVVKQNEPQKLTIRLLDGAGKPLGKVPAVFNLGGKQQTLVSDRSGKLELLIEQPELEEIPLDVFANPGSDEPSHRFTVMPGFLDPVDTVSGIQARLNSLGHDCGVADGIYGKKTKAGIESFEQENSLPVTGKLSETLSRAVERAYGC